MKIRHGFVSNSSSASFVVIGFDFPRGEFDRRKFVDIVLKHSVKGLDDDALFDIIWNEEGVGSWIYLDHEERGAPEGRSILGILISKTSSEDYCDKKAFCVESYITDIKRGQEALGMEGDIKIYTGSMVC